MRSSLSSPVEPVESLAARPVSYIVTIRNIEIPKLFFSTIPGCTYDISNKHRLGYSEVQLVQVMIDGVNTLWKEDVELQKKHGI